MLNLYYQHLASFMPTQSEFKSGLQNQQQEPCSSDYINTQFFQAQQRQYADQQQKPCSAFYVETSLFLTPRANRHRRSSSSLKTSSNISHVQQQWLP